MTNIEKALALINTFATTNTEKAASLLAEGYIQHIMSFDEGTGLAEHAAPGEALIFALDGEGVIGYEGKAHSIKAGENFKFAAGGRHWVKANGRFKMALLMTLE